MAQIMRNAVDRVYALLLLKDENPEKYESEIHSVSSTPSTGMIPVDSRRADARHPL